jgi:diacylglycerol kinase (ATP)
MNKKKPPRKSLSQKLVILNPASGKAPDEGNLSSIVGSLSEMELVRTRREGDARKFAKKGADEGYNIIVAAGGDGAVNEVVNGIMESDHRPIIGVLPLGTGNDLCRTLEIPLDPVVAAYALERGITADVDLLAAYAGHKSRYCVNVASAGFSGKIGKETSHELKEVWGPLAYAVSALDLLDKFQPYSVDIIRADGSSESFDAVNIFIANGRFTGGGIHVAPDANLWDGEFELVVVLEGKLIQILGSVTDLLTGKVATNEVLKRYRSKEVEIRSRPKLPLNLDGEFFTDESVSIGIERHAVKFIVGPDYHARV